MLSPRGIWKVTNLLAFWDGTLCVSVGVRAHVCHCACTCVSLRMHMHVRKQVCMQGCACTHM